jgi:hypothetical protein
VLNELIKIVEQKFFQRNKKTVGTKVLVSLLSHRPSFYCDASKVLGFVEVSPFDVVMN